MSVEHGPPPRGQSGRSETVLRRLHRAGARPLCSDVLNGWDGAWSASLGVGGGGQSPPRRGHPLDFTEDQPQAYRAAASPIGFLLRLGLFVGAVYLIATLVEVDRIAFGVSVVVLYRPVGLGGAVDHQG